MDRNSKTRRSISSIRIITLPLSFVLIVFSSFPSPILERKIQPSLRTQAPIIQDIGEILKVSVCPSFSLLIPSLRTRTTTYGITLIL